MQELLASGGDARISRNCRGTNEYGCGFVSQPDVLGYSSSTASTISPLGFDASERLYRKLKTIAGSEACAVTYAREMDRIRDELISLCELTSLDGLEIIFGASGTDLHLFATQLLRAGDDAPLRVIMPETSETGSGVRAAIQACHYSTRTALGRSVTAGQAITDAKDIEISTVKVRFPDGNLRPAHQVDAEVESLAAQAARRGQHVLLILTDVSKTGLIAPSPACIVELCRRWGRRIDVLVDACQCRLANATMRNYLRHDFLLAITGSKFVGGPAFCAALLAGPQAARRLRGRELPDGLRDYSARADWPAGWAARASLGDAANFGLLLRFEAALAQWRAFGRLPQTRIGPFLERFAAAVQQRLASEAIFQPLPARKINRAPIATGESWDRVPTIFPFLLRHASGASFNCDECSQIYNLMKKDLSRCREIPPSKRPIARPHCLLGQPVVCGLRNGAPISALRLNIDMRLIVDALSPHGRGADAVIAEVLLVLEKVALLGKYLFHGTGSVRDRPASLRRVRPALVKASGDDRGQHLAYPIPP